jgi:hypothetical protein
LPFFRRGDASGDGKVDIGDAIHSLNYLFMGGPSPACLDAADADDNGEVEITDAIGILRHLFLGGGPLPPPFGECGPDPGLDCLGCDAYSPCSAP